MLKIKIGTWAFLLFVSGDLNMCSPMSPTRYAVLSDLCQLGDSLTFSDLAYVSEGVEMTITATAQPSSIYKTVYARLRRDTQVPLRLPTYLASEAEPEKLYANVITATKTEYEIIIGFVEDCEGGNACRWGSAYGGKVEFKPEKGDVTVKLAGNIKGFFRDATCGANCSDSKIFWMQNGYLYAVGIKAAKLKALIKAANSAINAK